MTIIEKCLLFSFLIGFMAACQKAVEMTMEERGRLLLTGADTILYPIEGTYEIAVKFRQEGGRQKPQEYAMQGYKKGKNNQTLIWTKPEINRNDVGMRNGRVIYYKPANFHKADIYSYQAIFVDSPFSYGDILSSDLETDYTVTSIIDTLISDSVKAFRLFLFPKAGGLYARIMVLMRQKPLLTIARIYYTPSGEVLKTADFSAYQVQNGRATTFTVTVNHRYLDVHGYAVICCTESKKLPKFLFDPQNIARIQATK